MSLHKTKNDMSKDSRKEMCDLLSSRLADTLDLKLQAKQAHWNVKGPQFISLHELFDKVAGAFDPVSDEIAERIVQLGGTAEGTVQAIQSRTSLKAYSLKIVDGKDHVDALSDAVARYGKATRSAIEDANKAGDAGTTDLLTRISQEADKYLWFIEAHYQAK